MGTGHKLAKQQITIFLTMQKSDTFTMGSLNFFGKSLGEISFVFRSIERHRRSGVYPTNKRAIFISHLRLLDF